MCSSDLLVRLDRHERPLGTPAEREAVFAVVDAAFAQRRKTLRAALSGWAGSAADAEQILREAGIDPGARGETLEVEQFRAIAAAGAGRGAVAAPPRRPGGEPR